MATEDPPSSVDFLMDCFARNNKSQEGKPQATSFPVERSKGASLSNHIFTPSHVEIYNVRLNIAKCPVDASSKVRFL